MQVFFGSDIFISMFVVQYRQTHLRKVFFVKFALYCRNIKSKRARRNGQNKPIIANKLTLKE